MTTTLLVRPVVTALRDWLRTQDTAAEARVYSGSLPDGAALPALMVRRVGDGTPAEWLTRPLIQLDAVAASGGAAETLAAEVEQLLATTAEHTEITEGLLFMGAEALSTVEVPDPDRTDRQRYVHTTALTVKAVEIPEGP